MSQTSGLSLSCKLSVEQRALELGRSVMQTSLYNATAAGPPLEDVGQAGRALGRPSLLIL